MAHTLKQWKHPTTKQQRVYINVDQGDSVTAKVWFEENQGRPVLKSKSDSLSDFSVYYRTAKAAGKLEGLLPKQQTLVLAQAVANAALDEYLEITLEEALEGSFDQLWQDAL